jgi:hypothetical protein
LTQVNLWAKQKANVDLEKQMSRLEKDSGKKKAIIGKSLTCRVSSGERLVSEEGYYW